MQSSPFFLRQRVVRELTVIATDSGLDIMAAGELSPLRTVGEPFRIVRGRIVVDVDVALDLLRPILQCPSMVEPKVGYLTAEQRRQSSE